MVNNYINAKDALFYKKRFYNVLASIPFVFISVIGMYLLDVELMYFVIFTGIAIMTLLTQFIYYYSNWKKSLK
ncbi:hypothetical protein CN568_23195 [Bacillus pseudomycoides]|uniref:hypothetical protein n=1 Tax=Bacillus pseudomycoides TaxID=64104 RepID=UPI000BED6B76|nr:hypothetical protein [Bacillus pseudomycoides]PEY35740.1 hypothetical protein CN354_15055 [Bacillus cereus]PDZ74503.1 hypothetical protein CON58_06875 [Bacillus pseudomycoides]PEJ16702.1 hypothetical protein CN887_30210 [Bacillus pseudomycoides]PEK29229.1 hypothetical protein CN691_21935 [Bacillus pseudomycoides]PEK62176.1 hypothetical protein CN593_25735 [Bacillus pseudomycoides]